MSYYRKCLSKFYQLHLCTVCSIYFIGICFNKCCRVTENTFPYGVCLRFIDCIVVLYVQHTLLHQSISALMLSVHSSIDCIFVLFVQTTFLHQWHNKDSLSGICSKKCCWIVENMHLFFD